MQIHFTPFPLLFTERLVLRQITEQDRNEIYQIRNNSAVNRYIDRPSEYSMEEIINFIEKINRGIDQNEWINWAICYRDQPAKLLGTICLWNISEINESAETGYEMDPAYHGGGIMTEAMKAVLEFGFNTMKLKTIHAFTNEQNIPSLRLLEKYGFARNSSLDKEMEPVNEVIYSLNK